MVRLLRDAGGDVVFFVTPESEAFQRGYRSAAHRANAARFAEHVRAWNSCLLEPSFEYTDEDLPDLWRLRLERTAEFTEAGERMVDYDSPPTRTSGGDGRRAVSN